MADGQWPQCSAPASGCLGLKPSVQKARFAKLRGMLRSGPRCACRSGARRWRRGKSPPGKEGRFGAGLL